MVQAAGVEVGSRYQVPSAHITLGRFLVQEGHDTPEKREKWIKAIDEVNQWLERKNVQMDEKKEKKTIRPAEVSELKERSKF